jgi:2-polyprenyl-3-methyl-5-hydroxy-6-metoxy-1,4-benzoquinol methylase
LGNINYHGFDIAENAINMCKKYEKENIKFEVLDATSQELPQADLIICKDLFLHLSFKDIFAVLANIKDKCKYFAVSRYNTNTVNKDQESGLGAREIEIQTPPFNFDKEIIKVIVYSNECANNEMVIYKM